MSTTNNQSPFRTLRSLLLQLVCTNSVKHGLDESFTLSGSVDKNQQFLKSVPTSLTSNSYMKIKCNNNNQNACLDCLKSNNIDNTDLDNENNIDIIENIKQKNCEGLCYCNIQNIDLETNLFFNIGTSINYENINQSKIYSNVISDLKSGSIKRSATKNSPSGYLGFAALGGLIGDIVAAVAGSQESTVDTKIEADLKRIIGAVSQTYTQVINQLIITSQVFTIEGTGIRVKSVSMNSLYDITFNSVINYCNGGKCVIDDLNNITTTIIDSYRNNVSSSFLSMFKTAFETNLPLIIGAGIFCGVLFVVWLILIINKALKK